MSYTVILCCFLCEIGDSRVVIFPTTAEKRFVEFEWKPLAWARRVSYTSLTSTSLRGIMCITTEAVSPWLHKTHYFQSGTGGIRRGDKWTSGHQAIIEVRWLHGNFLWNTGKVWIRFWPSLWVYSLLFILAFRVANRTLFHLILHYLGTWLLVPAPLHIPSTNAGRKTETQGDWVHLEERASYRDCPEQGQFDLGRDQSLTEPRWPIYEAPKVSSHQTRYHRQWRGQQRTSRFWVQSETRNYWAAVSVRIPEIPEFNRLEPAFISDLRCN